MWQLVSTWTYLSPCMISICDIQTKWNSISLILLQKMKSAISWIQEACLLYSYNNAAKVLAQCQNCKLLIIWEWSTTAFSKGEHPTLSCYMRCLEEGHGLLSILSSVPMVEVELQWLLHQWCIVVNVQHWAGNSTVLWNGEWPIQEISIPDLQLLASRNGSTRYEELGWFLHPWFESDDICIRGDWKRLDSPNHKAGLVEKVFMALKGRCTWRMGISKNRDVKKRLISPAKQVLHKYTAKRILLHGNPYIYLYMLPSVVMLCIMCHDRSIQTWYLLANSITSWAGVSDGMHNIYPSILQCASVTISDSGQVSHLMWRSSFEMVLDHH